jgi:hypothetical protein
MTWSHLRKGRKEPLVPLAWAPRGGADVVAKLASVESRTSVDEILGSDYRLSYPTYTLISYLPELYYDVKTHIYILLS